ncbi:MAG: GTP 3',8-cyclase MoaA [Aquificae bacterium]|nr:GTP 3',8-cyclase MoaA [Aquificota bacterium]
MLKDKLGRPLRVLRLSLTDRCNLRCSFCMPPGKRYEFLPSRRLMSPEKIERLVKAFVTLGVKKVRLTGGEPLLRPDLEEVVERLARLEGLNDLALTTNGVNLENRLESLKKAGLKRITFSLHSLRPERNAVIVNRPVDPLRLVETMEEAKKMGFTVKVNAVVVRGLNDDEVEELAAFFKRKKITLRFIEFMDVGTVNRWSLEKVVTAKEIITRLRRVFNFKPLPRKPSDTALNFVYDDGTSFGVVASVSMPFCRGCDRARVSADGKLYTCLFAERGTPLNGSLTETVERVWRERTDRYSELRLLNGLNRSQKVEMYRVGG